jgi:hypothetical protein
VSLLDFTNALTTAWEAVVPTTDPRRRFRRIEKPGRGGASRHRGFWFDPASYSVGEIEQQGAGHILRHYDFEARVGFYIPDRMSAEFEGLYLDELALTLAAVAMPRPNNVIAPRVLSAGVRATPGAGDGDFDLVIKCDCRVREAVV